MPAAALLEEARPLALDGDTLTIEFASGAEFHRRQIEEPKNADGRPRRAVRGDRSAPLGLDDGRRRAAARRT